MNYLKCIYLSFLLKIWSNFKSIRKLIKNFRHVYFVHRVSWNSTSKKKIEQIKSLSFYCASTSNVRMDLLLEVLSGSLRSHMVILKNLCIWDSPQFCRWHLIFNEKGHIWKHWKIIAHWGLIWLWYSDFVFVIYLTSEDNTVDLMKKAIFGNTAKTVKQPGPTIIIELSKWCI